VIFRLDPPAGGPENMAEDQRLLALAEDGISSLRLYSWSDPWVTLGQFQTPDRALGPQCPVPWVMRPTGGRGVLHGHDLTLAAGISLGLLGFGTEDSRSAIQIYRAVIQPIAAALRACGVPAVLGEEAGHLQQGAGPDDCFAHIAPNDVVNVHSGAKVMGCSLRLTLESVLIQASIPCGPPLVDPSLVFKEPGVPSWTPEVTPESLLEALNDEFGRTLASK
jgi:lipoyl(octanoyl) transferase